MKHTYIFGKLCFAFFVLLLTLPASGANNTGRNRIYHAYPNPSVTAKDMKTSEYSKYQNPTGIYFEKGEEVIVTAKNTSGKTVLLKITNFGKGGGESQYPLNEGTNRFTAQNRGNGYIQYHANNTDNTVEIEIKSGKVNGFFNAETDNNQTWKTLLANASGDILDIIGTRTQLAYDVESLKKHCPEKGIELIALYDSIITIQHELMGLNKYNKVPANKIFGRVIWEGFMHADGLGAAFHVSTLEILANPAKLRENTWGVAHEFGHVNQVRPDMKWVGTTEVTNNIYSVWTQYVFNPDKPKFETEFHTCYDKPVICGRFNSYMESAFIHKQEWLTQAGPDDWKRWHEDGKYWHGDHFVKLIPLWQLQLYFAVAGKGTSWYTPDLYADIFNQAIENNEKLTDGQHQLNFIKRACDVTKTDLTGFFEKAGILVVIDKFIGDYTSAQLTITQEDVDKLKKYASQYKKPAQALNYISANSLDAFQNKKAVTGKKNNGCTPDGQTITVDHTKWKNVTAFETYSGNKLVKIALAGTGSEHNATTLVQYPEGATRVEAIAWNGKKSLVYGNR